MININDKKLVIGVDIGGSHITAGAVDLLNRNVLEETVIRKAVDSHAPAAVIIAVWAGVIEAVAGLANISAMQVGFAMPGSFDYEKGICFIKGFNKYEALYNINIREELAQRLGVSGADILFRNDSEAFLDGEIFCGAAIGYKDVIGITLGTGLGSAYSHDGITADAELSVTPYKDEMIEAHVSTRGLLRNCFRLTGQQLSNAKEIAAKYESDANARMAYKGSAITFSKKSDIRILDGQAAIEYRSWYAGRSIVRATSSGLKSAEIEVIFTGNHSYKEGVTPKPAERPYIKFTKPADEAQQKTSQRALIQSFGRNNPMFASSNDNNSSPGFAADGDSATCWKPNAADKTPFLILDTEKKLSIKNIAVLFKAPAVYQYKIEISHDRQTWTLAEDCTGNTKKEAFKSIALSNRSGRYVRVSFVKPVNVAVAEIEVLGIVL